MCMVCFVGLEAHSLLLFLCGYVLYGQEVFMHVELQLASFRLSFQVEELKESDLIQRFNTLLALDEQRWHSLDIMERRKQSVKKYVFKHANTVTFEVG